MSENVELRNEYFNWLCRQAIDNLRARDNMSRLLELLYTLEFKPLMEEDRNRWMDGNDIKYTFAWNYEISYDYIDEALEMRCSILELMVALAYKMEDRYMATINGPSQVSIWFGQMLESLGLSEMNNFNFNDEYIRLHIDILNNRQYEDNGQGGLFTIYNPIVCMPDIGIWKQMTIKCNEMLKNEINLNEDN